MKQSIWVLVFLFLHLASCKKDDVTAENSQLVTISSLSQMQEKTNSGVSLVFFHATWCPLCANQRPHIENLVGDPELSTVFLGQVDFEKHNDIVDKYNVFGFPTILILKDGEIRHALAGSNNSTTALKELLQGL